LADELTVALQPVDFAQADSLRHFYRAGAADAGAGVTIGIIDGGVGPHPDIVCEADTDNGSGHGTHVAGIIAGRGAPPTGILGLAPGAKLRSYRVFGTVGGLAANFSVAKAIDTAALEDKCDLINLSFNLEGASDDPAVRSALEDAREAGVLPIAATGNNFRQGVGFPARDPMCIAVSALGRKGTFPVDSLETSDVVAPFGRDDSDFIAAFSNVGMEVDVTAPGSGIISTVPGGYGVMSGTSMACPVVTGMAARLLARNQELLTMERGPERSARLAQLVMHAAASLGFTADLQGAGLPHEQGEV
jgi:subtilisin